MALKAMKMMMRRSANLLTTAVLLTLCITTSRAQTFGTPLNGTYVGKAPVVNTTSGPVVGAMYDVNDDTNILGYLGIPYAASTAGVNRWQPPKDPESWVEPRDATKYGKRCMQMDDDWYKNNLGFGYVDALGVNVDVTYEGSNATSMSEDCLFLNVFTPSVGNDDTEAKKPVMVWIHGGGNLMGAGSNYNPVAFVRDDDFVMVTLNYRLGYFGFFAHPELDGANFGLQDQIFALEWVQENIAAFGGDPDQVTIFGESAGGAAVLALMTSPLSEGLFSAAIAESAAPQLRNVTIEEAGEIGLAVAKVLDIPEGQDQLEQLRNTSAEDFVTILAEFTTEREQGYQKHPEIQADLSFVNFIIDNYSILGDVFDSFADGLNHKVPFIIGSNANETTFLDTSGGHNHTTVEQYHAFLNATFGEDGMQEILKVMNASTDQEAWEAYSQVYTANMFGTGAYEVANSMAQRGEPVYFYQFTKGSDGPGGVVLGSYHGAEMGYVWNDTAEGPIESQDLANTVHSYWTEFASSHDPNAEGLPQWPIFQGENWQVIGDNVSNVPIPEQMRTIYEQSKPVFFRNSRRYEIS